MARGVLLDAHARLGHIDLVLATTKGLEHVALRARYRVYLLPTGSYTAQEVAQGIEAVGAESWVEEWLAPPWYTEVVEVVVVESGDPQLLNSIASRLRASGIARRVNDYPGMLVEALWRHNTLPGHLVDATPQRVRLLEDPGDPLYEPPPLRLARLEAYSWHGPVSTPLEEPDYYQVICHGTSRKARSGGEALEALRDCRPHIVVASLEARSTLPATPTGWLWFDPHDNLVGVWGLIEWMRVSTLPYHMAHGAAIGKVLTAAEAREAYKRRYLLDPKAPRTEHARSLRRLLEADMAGAARIPRPGLYWGVIQLDYSSLYPSLIARYNISAETVGRRDCVLYEEAPVVGHRICHSLRGLVSTVLHRLVERRRRIKEASPGDPRVAERAEALKWILVSGFGYLGYRNSLFGSITAYEAVTAYARWALAVAEETAEEHGYRVIHSIIDSIFLRPTPGAEPIEEVTRRVEEAVGVPLRIDARYNWLYIPATLKGTGAVNKYYGSLVEGGVKLRGIMAVRSDTPPLIAGAQLSAIRALAKARDPVEWPGALREAERRLEWYRDLIASGRAPVRGLVIEKTPDPDAARGSPWRKASATLPIRPRRIRYVVTPRGPQHVSRMPLGYDKTYYLRLLESVYRELPSSPGTPDQGSMAFP